MTTHPDTSPPDNQPPPNSRPGGAETAANHAPETPATISEPVATTAENSSTPVATATATARPESTTSPAASVAESPAPAGMATRPATHRPDIEALGSRALAEFVWTLSIAMFALGLGRWLALLSTGEVPPSPAPAPVQAAGWLTDAATVDVLAAAGTGISLEQFLTNVQWFITGILAALTCTFFMIGFIRMVSARGESEEYEKGKQGLRSALYGFLGTMLTPALVNVLQSLFQGRR